jgi:hypothetical protein
MKTLTLHDEQLGIIADALILLKGNESYDMEQCQEILDMVTPDCSGHMIDRNEPDDSMDGDFDSAMASAGMGIDEDYEHNLINDEE